MIQAPLRQQIIDAAIDLTSATGWSSVTMSGLADVVGVSRQTVYNEVGSKPALAEAMVLDELARFLALVETAFDEHPDDPVNAVRAAVAAVLNRADGSGLLRAIVSASYGQDSALLPLLTTQASALLSTASEVVQNRLRPCTEDLDERHLAVTVDVIVRTVLGHVMQPTMAARECADGLAWITGLALTNAAATPGRT